MITVAVAKLGIWKAAVIEHRTNNMDASVKLIKKPMAAPRLGLFNVDNFRRQKSTIDPANKLINKLQKLNIPVHMTHIL